MRRLLFGFGIFLVLALCVLLVLKQQRSTEKNGFNKRGDALDASGKVWSENLQSTFGEPTPKIETKEVAESLKKDKPKSLATNAKPKPGMISVETVLEMAVQHASQRSSFSTNQVPDIALVEDRYVVTFWQRKNPYRPSVRYFDSKVRIDAWTGEFIRLEFNQSGVKGFGFSPKIGDGTLTTAEERGLFQKMTKKIEVLDAKAIQEGVLPEGENPSPEMVNAQDVIRAAEIEVADRNYDRKQSPQAVLIDDVYIVIFWKHPDAVPVRGRIYDSRVAIDAKTGEYIAMEITR